MFPSPVISDVYIQKNFVWKIASVYGSLHYIWLWALVPILWHRIGNGMQRETPLKLKKCTNKCYQRVKLHVHCTGTQFRASTLFGKSWCILVKIVKHVAFRSLVEQRKIVIQIYAFSLFLHLVLFFSFAFDVVAKAYSQFGLLEASLCVLLLWQSKFSIPSSVHKMQLV